MGETKKTMLPEGQQHHSFPPGFAGRTRPKGGTPVPQSLARIALHLTFSTKDRRRVFRTDEMRNHTAAYITGILQHMDCPLVRIAVAADHAHVLHLLSRTRPVADVVAAVKRDSSTWIKDQTWARGNADFAQFHWQNGYAAFSVSHSRIDAVAAYIDGQVEHHKRVTFQDEYRDLLRRHEITFDEKYVWE
jgi:REP element-mobilizing transposase RayT